MRLQAATLTPFGGLLLAACAATAPAEGEAAKLAAADAGKVTCRYEHKVGSNRPRRICTTEEERKLARERALRAVDRLSRQHPEPPRPAR